MKRLRRLDDAGPLITARTEFTSGLRKENYGNFTSMSGGGPGVDWWPWPLRHPMTSHLDLARWGYLPDEYLSSVRHATYVVRSYDTPMAWWLDRPVDMSDTDTVELWLANGQVGFWVMPSVKYSPTTSNHQGTIADAIDPYYETDDAGEILRGPEVWHQWGTEPDQGYMNFDYIRRAGTTEYRQRGHDYKHKYKNRGENADGPSVDRSYY